MTNPEEYKRFMFCFCSKFSLELAITASLTKSLLPIATNDAKIFVYPADQKYVSSKNTSVMLFPT